MPHVQTPVTNYARSRGWRARRMQYIGRHACPDSWFFMDGRVIVVEFKDLGEEPEIHQKREIRRLRESGLAVHVIDNVEDGCALFD
ncbi:hypothetical protein FJ423_01015 [Mesorhizobium sp. B2-8-9]|nr:hypothetical protein FJ423_01015 [Mesorhizobium sp. B2-8-9]